MEAKDLLFLDRCCDLARLAGAAVSPNPRVGAVLVYQGKIIGEGFHQRSGQAHAEVNCLASVAREDQHLIADSILYVSLEPCCFHGRTPACTSLILEHGIKEVVIGQLDQSPEVSGKGVNILTSAGVTVRAYPEHRPSRLVALERQMYASQKRPYVILKYAQSADHFLAPADARKYWISSPGSRILTHRWRAQTGAILVGATTVIKDDPQLTTRLYPGPQPIRVVLDPKGRCSGQETVFQNQEEAPTLWFRPAISGLNTSAEIIPFEGDYLDSARAILTVLYERQIHQLTVEGGLATLRLFLETGLWDEIRRFTNPACYFGNGVDAPNLSGYLFPTTGKEQEQTDEGMLTAALPVRNCETRPAEVQKIGQDILEQIFR